MNVSSVAKTWGPLIVALINALVQGIQGHLTEWSQPLGPVLVILSLVVSLANVFATWRATNTDTGPLHYAKLIAGSCAVVAQAILATAATVGGLENVTPTLWMSVVLTAVAAFQTWLFPNEPELVATAEDGTGQQIRLYGALPTAAGATSAPEDPLQPAAGVSPTVINNYAPPATPGA
jgi:hypothetical protein